jgi:hypothetical protein
MKEKIKEKMMTKNYIIEEKTKYFLRPLDSEEDAAIQFIEVVVEREPKFIRGTDIKNALDRILS